MYTWRVFNVDNEPSSHSIGRAEIHTTVLLLCRWDEQITCGGQEERGREMGGEGESIRHDFSDRDCNLNTREDTYSHSPFAS